MIQKEELRIGNILNYSTAENDIYKTTLDWQDLKWISEDPKSFNLVHNSIPLTKKWLLKFGFEIYKLNNGAYEVKLNDYFTLKFITKDKFRENDAFYLFTNDDDSCIVIQYVHSFQNLFFALTEKELEIN